MKTEAKASKEGVKKVNKNMQQKNNNKKKYQTKTAKNKLEKTEKKNGKIQNKARNKKKKNVKLRRYIFITIFFTIILSIITIRVLLSPAFNIKQITVVNNQNVTVDKIIEKSGLVVGYNMFRTPSRIIKNNIKENPYIENVKITKKINGEIIITVSEREPTYMLQTDGGYAYINNQGYILEISNMPLNVPVIKGYNTEEIKLGQRLIVDDLKKLDKVIQIMEIAESNKINEKISTIDITDINNFILELPTELKKVEFGKVTDINVKILWIVDLIEREKGKEGSIILTGDNIKKVYFREKV